MSVNGNTVDTGRYTITASKDDGGTVKVFDKESNTFVKAFGDPHLVTSDGDKANFQKSGLSIELPDGTSVHMKPTAADDKGVSFLDSCMVEKDGQAVTMNGLHTGEMQTSGVQDGADEMRQDYMTQGQTVLDASDKSVADLFMTAADGTRTNELKSPDKETALDGKGGALDGDHGGAANASDGAAKGASFGFNPEMLQKLGQCLYLTGANVSNPGMQQDVLGGIQNVLSSFIKPALN